MTFRVKHFDSFGHGWISIPLRPVDDKKDWAREVAPYRFSQQFQTFQEAEAAVVEMRGRFPETLTFEIVPDYETPAYLKPQPLQIGRQEAGNAVAKSCAEMA